MDAGAALATSFRHACAARGWTPDPSLRLLDHATADDAPPEHVAAPGELGALHERLLASGERTARGVWYTPGALAADLVGWAVPDPGVVSDPSCGGGAFLLAAADRLADLGVDTATVVTELLWGCDVDPLAVAVAEAALWWWSAQRGAPTVAGDRLVVGDALVEVALPPSVAVVGNPPFLGQLKGATTADPARRAALRERWGDAMAPYTDASALFLLAAVEATTAGGRVAMVQPQSMLASRDSERVRRRVSARARLVDCWFDEQRSFAAAVEACAPMLEVGASGSSAWSGTLAQHRGVPVVTVRGRGRLVDRATVVAGFRDEYYGLVDAVGEAGEGVAARRTPRLVTVGSIDPLRVLDGEVRFAKRRWRAPVVDASRAEGRAVRWVEAQAGPKIVVATQTKIVEAAVDPAGELVASVPAIVVAPRDVEDLWAIAAAVHAPCIAAWMLRRTAGTALAADACKPTAAVLEDLPLPVDDAAWADATRRAIGIAAAGGTVSSAEWRAFGASADAAYGIADEGILEWWVGRLPARALWQHPDP